MNSSSANSGSASTMSWSAYADNIFSQEKVVFKTNIPLVLSTSLVTAVYSYIGIDGNVNNAVSRALLMALSTFFGASAVNILENNNYITPASNNGRYLEAALIPLFYYFISKRQFAMPEMQSQTLKTGILSSVVAELANPVVAKYYTQYTTSTPATASVSATKSSTGSASAPASQPAVSTK